MIHTRSMMKKQGLYDPQFEHDACGVGFVCNIDGIRTNTIIQQGLTVLEHLTHRGATGSDPLTGDGAGILLQIPHEFFKKVCPEAGITLPERGRYGAGLIFLPQNAKERAACEKAFKAVVAAEGAAFLGFRDVPVANEHIGQVARRSEPVMKQAFIGFDASVTAGVVMDRKLYVIRRRIEKAVEKLKLNQESFFYITNLSSRTLIYKGLLTPRQVREYFRDLQDPLVQSALALVHSRYSTNTFPTWDLAQPFRFLAHNGEINTLRGNVNWMHARESLFKSETLGRDVEKIKPVITPGKSDSATLDFALELLYLNGRSLEHAMTMLVPDSWNQLNPIPEELRAYYEFHACCMEPWDGPAALAYTDGDVIGGMLDRNGLRPSRYIITHDNFCVLASEVGVLAIAPERVKIKGRLRPGKVLLIDTTKKKVYFDEEIKARLAAAAPYQKWVKQYRVMLKDLPRPKGHLPAIDEKKLLCLQKNFGYSREELKMLMKPMATQGVEPTGSMGNDAPLAIFSDKHPPLYNYFKQLFAQVPPIDSYREILVMSSASFIGRQKDILTPTPQHCEILRTQTPVFTVEDLEKIKARKEARFKTGVIDIVFDPAQKGSLKKALAAINAKAEALIRKGYTYLVLSDRKVSKTRAAIPALLATGSVHHHLVRKELRTQAGLIVETGEAREVMHFALLIGYGADAVCPYLAYATLKAMRSEGMFEGKEPYKKLEENYIHALTKGLLKICSKMGISTIRSYRGAQIFEAVGLGSDVIDRYFTGTPSRIGGASLSDLERETVERHQAAFIPVRGDNALLNAGGQYQALKQGERHGWSPEAITHLQMATRTGDHEMYKRFAEMLNNQDKRLFHLRGMLEFKKVKSISIDEVEPAAAIVKRFVTGAMSYGSISREAHEAMALAMNRLGGKSNSGEGGEDPVRFIPLPNGDSLRSAIKQVASGRFGVTSNYLTNADEIQIKMAQGAKPGEGGQLPGHKVDQIIAKTRYSTPGVTLISPPPHHDIYSIEDLAQLIFDLKNANPRARISVKLVSEIGVGTIAAGVAKGHADMILISGHDGGTGASPLSSIKHAGLPWELGIAETQQTLVMHDLRGRTRLQTDGMLRTGRDVAIAALLGAEEYGFATAALVVLGCVMMRKCHLNTCPVGVATQDPLLRSHFKGKPEYLVTYFHFVAEELRGIMASLGLRTVDEMIGRVDLLEAKKAIDFWKARRIDLSNLVYKPVVPDYVATHCVQKQDHGIDGVLDKKLIEMTQAAWQNKEQVSLTLPITNIERTTGAMLSGTISGQWGEEALPDGTITVRFNGTAGQSFGAFLVRGVTFELEGDANDYVGKGLAGGRIIMYPPKKATFVPEENIIAGNVLFYGATRGEAYLRGVVGERFCIRNSGVYAVVEGVGEHGCEYMTGGRVIVLGSVGRNFAAGMSGGIAYVWDREGNFDYFCNKSMVLLEKPNEQDINTMQEMLHKHVTYTGSTRAQYVLDNFSKEIKKFVKVFPIEYKRVLEAARQIDVVAKEGTYDGTA